MPTTGADGAFPLRFNAPYEVSAVRGAPPPPSRTQERAIHLPQCCALMEAIPLHCDRAPFASTSRRLGEVDCAQRKTEGVGVWGRRPTVHYAECERTVAITRSPASAITSFLPR